MSNEDDSGSERRVAGGEDGTGSLQGLPADVRRGWREFKELVQGLAHLVESAASIGLDLYRLAGRTLRFAVSHRGVMATLSVILGISSPLTEGWGVLGGLVDSELALWIPVPLTVAVAIGLCARARRGDDRSFQSDPAPTSIVAVGELPFTDQLMILESHDAATGQLSVQVRVTRRPLASTGQTVLQGMEKPG